MRRRYLLGCLPGVGLVWCAADEEKVRHEYVLESSFSGSIGPQFAGTIEEGRRYDVKIKVEGKRVRCYLDDKQIHDVKVPESLGFSIYGGAGRTAKGEIVVRLVNASPVKQNVTIALAGAGSARYAAAVTELSSKDLDAENSLGEPTRIAPRKYELQKCRNSV